MRFAWAGCLLLLLCLCGPARGQSGSEVESIGFDNAFRADAWTPLVVRIRTDGLESGLYRLEVVQDDVDRDRAIYTRLISIDSAQPVQRFWMYFQPRPTDGGLPSASTLVTLARSITVRLATERGRELAIIPVTASVQALDEPSARLGRRLVLAISDGTSQPMWREYASALGISEDLLMVSLAPRSLPENAIGYEGIDAIVWLDADAAELDDAGSRRGEALRQYVRDGGRLVVCQPDQRSKIAPLASMLPVKTLTPGRTDDWQMKMRFVPMVKPLLTIAAGPSGTPTPEWTNLKGPFSLAHALPLDDALVEQWIDWNDDGVDVTPYIARRVLGFGSVTWVAHDLGSPSLVARGQVGWSRVWDAVLGYRQAPSPGTRDEGQVSGIALRFPPGNPVDVGVPLLSGSEHPGRGAALVAVALVFFGAYWLIAGPVIYFVLGARGKSRWNWPAFAAVAVAATLLTFLLVRLVLRGDGSIRHLSVIRSAPTQTSRVISRIGLYMPRDARLAVTVGKPTDGTAGYVSPLPAHPGHVAVSEVSPPPLVYVVPVPDSANAPADVVVPFRTTLKKLRAVWHGDAGGGIAGTLRLASAGPEGRLQNATGTELVDIFIVWRDLLGLDRMLYLPRWPTDAIITLDTEAYRNFIDPARGVVPWSDQPVFGRFGSPGAEIEWEPQIFGPIASSIGRLDDASLGYRYSFLVLSLFDRLPTMAERVSPYRARVEMLRRGGRDLDVSQVVTAGQVLVLARSTEDQPLPLPLTVGGDSVESRGTLLHQAVVPLTRPNTPPVTLETPNPG